MQVQEYCDNDFVGMIFGSLWISSRKNQYLYSFLTTIITMVYT
jgi:hypothetical protein